MKRKKRKNKKTVQLTDNSREYKLTKRRDSRINSCPICPPHRGCNRNWNLDRNWKNFRKTQWKE